MPLTVLLLGLSAAPVAAQPPESPAVREPKVTPRLPPPRARLRVRPLYPYRATHSFYPPPFDVDYPGPNAHRECTVAYVTERRPSGPVVTPRMNCRWVPGRIPF